MHDLTGDVEDDDEGIHLVLYHEQSCLDEKIGFGYRVKGTQGCVTKFSKTTSSLISNEFIPLGFHGKNCKWRSLSFRPGHRSTALPPPPVPIFTPFRCAIPFPCIIQPLLVDFNFTRDIIEKGIMRFDRSSVSLILSRIRYLALLFFFLIERYALMK